MTFALYNSKDDVLGGKYKEIDRVTFQGVGSNPQKEDNCLIRSRDSLACSVCIDGFYYFNGLCKKKTQVCLKYNFTSNKCELCHDNFVNTQGECIDPNC